MQTILSDGLTSLHTLTVRHGKGLIHALRAISRKLHMRARIVGRHLHLQLSLIQSRRYARKCIKRLIDQQHLKTKQPRRSDLRKAKRKAPSCYQCSTSAELATMHERLTNTDWAD